MLSREEEEFLVQRLVEIIRRREVNDGREENIPSLQEMWAKIENR
jgi:hypothetical protein